MITAADRTHFITHPDVWAFVQEYRFVLPAEPRLIGEIPPVQPVPERPFTHPVPSQWLVGTTAQADVTMHYLLSSVYPSRLPAPLRAQFSDEGRDTVLLEALFQQRKGADGRRVVAQIGMRASGMLDGQLRTLEHLAPSLRAEATVAMVRFIYAYFQNLAELPEVSGFPPPGTGSVKA